MFKNDCINNTYACEYSLQHYLQCKALEMTYMAKPHNSPECTGENSGSYMCNIPPY